MSIYNRALLRQQLDNNAPIVEVAGRATGRTTANILEALVGAIRTPGAWVTVKRHIGEPHTLAWGNTMTQATRIVANKLGLQGIEVLVTRTDVGPLVQVRSTFCEEL